MRFKDKTVWITGASSGIGEALAYAFSDEGARLILSARREKELNNVKSACSGPGEIMVLPLDLEDHSSFPEKVKIAIDHFDKVDILVNNGGISQRDTAINTCLEVDKRIMEVNYFGTIGLTKALLPSFIENKSGHIVVISSVLGKVGYMGRTGYCASKHALHGYFDGLRAELHSDGIKVTIICPGYVHTNVSVNAFKGDGSKHEIMDEATSKGISAEKFALKSLTAIYREKFEVNIGGKEIRYILLKRLFPGLVARALNRR